MMFDWMPLAVTVAGVSWAAWLFVISAVLVPVGLWIMDKEEKSHRGYGSESKMLRFGFYLFATALCSTLAFFVVALAIKSDDSPEPTRAAQVAPSQISDKVFLGLEPVRVNVQTPDGSKGAVIIYGKRSEGVFTPVAYRARFWNLAEGTDFASWQLSLVADKNLLATVGPQDAIRADGRWQEGRTTPGSFVTSDTAQVEFQIGDYTNWISIPVAL